MSSELGRLLNPGDRFSVTEGRGVVNSHALLSLLNLSVHYWPAVKLGECTGTFLNRETRVRSVSSTSVCHTLITMCFILYSIFPC